MDSDCFLITGGRGGKGPRNLFVTARISRIQYNVNSKKWKQTPCVRCVRVRSLIASGEGGKNA